MKFVLRLKIGKHLFSNFKVNKVLEQGDAIAPLWFNVVLEILIRSQVETYLTNVVELWHMLMMWLLQEEDYKMLKEVFASLLEQTNKMRL
jgi:hypothetical protein